MAAPGASAPTCCRHSSRTTGALSSNLTLNLGLRWELHTPWVEVDNRQSNFGLISGQIEIAGQDGNSWALYNQYNGITNFQPRLGFAWTPWGRKTVIRGVLYLVLLPGRNRYQPASADQSAICAREERNLHIVCDPADNARRRLHAHWFDHQSVRGRPDASVGSQHSAGGFQPVEPHHPAAAQQHNDAAGRHMWARRPRT